MLETFWRGFEAEEDEMVRRGEEGMKLLVGPRLPSPEQRWGELCFVRSSFRNDATLLTRLHPIFSVHSAQATVSQMPLMIAIGNINAAQATTKTEATNIT